MSVLATKLVTDIKHRANCADLHEMKHVAYLSLIALVHLSACGKPKSTKGFFSDANICRPIPLPDYNPIDVVAGNFAIPAPTSGVVRTAQLTTAETEKKIAWGAEIYLSSGLDLAANLKITTLVKRKNQDFTEIPTIGPDASTASQPFVGPIQTMTATITPGWVRTQFPGTITLAAGDAIWLNAEPDFIGENQTVMWWYTSGSGAYFAAAAAPLYVNIPGIQTIHRLIYCE